MAGWLERAARPARVAALPVAVAAGAATAGSPSTGAPPPADTYSHFVEPPPLVPSSDALMAWWVGARHDDERWQGLHTPRAQVITRWDPAMRDAVLYAAEAGELRRLGQFIDAMRSDGLIAGIMGTRTSGMLRVPIKLSGDPFLVELLRGRDPQYDAEGYCTDKGVAGQYWRMFPEAEVASLMFCGIMAGVGIGEMVPQLDGPPIFRCLDLQGLRYCHETEKWYYRTLKKEYVVNPGDGRWVLFLPYGSSRPWIKGAWWPVALPFITKQNAAFDRLRWQAQLADPLKVIEAADGADESHRESLIEFIRSAWRRAAGLVTPPKYKAGLVESNGRGYEVYTQGESRADIDIQVALAGQVVTTTGTTGFSSGNVWDDIRLDMVQSIAEALATTIHWQALRPWADRYHGARERAPWVRWDVRSPGQRKAEAEALKAVSEAVEKADAVLAPRGERVAWKPLLEEHGLSVPTERLPMATATAPSNVVNLARAA